MATYYPPVGFHFRAQFDFTKDGSVDTFFQSVAGLEASVEEETIKEGGENRFEHGLPGRSKFSTLTLKRGMVRESSLPGDSIAKWCRETVEQNIYRPVNLIVVLLNEAHAPLQTWKIIHAWPKSWKFGELNAEKGEVFLETLELRYNRFELLVT